MLRWFSIFRDPKIWAAILVAAVIRVGWGLYWQSTVDAELAEYEARMAALPPEERMKAELETFDRLGRDVLGVDLQMQQLGDQLEEIAALQAELAVDPAAADELELALRDLGARRPRPSPAPTTEIPVIRFDEPEQQDLPPWLIAGALGGMILLVGAAGSLYVLRTTGDDDEPSDGAAT